MPKPTDLVFRDAGAKNTTSKAVKNTKMLTAPVFLIVAQIIMEKRGFRLKNTKKQEHQTE